jgi:hypothetical protein
MGLAGTFLPINTLVVADIVPSKSTIILCQMMGGLYLGFAILNWMNRKAPMGGIYGKPVATANLLHFMVVGLMLLKEVFRSELGHAFIVLSILYALFALGFGSTLFIDPFSRRQDD